MFESVHKEEKAAKKVSAATFKDPVVQVNTETGEFSQGSKIIIPTEVASEDTSEDDLHILDSDISKLDQQLFVDGVLDLTSGKYEALEVKDNIFDGYMKQQLLEDFVDSLRDYFDDDSVNEISNTLQEFSDEEIYAAVSLPFELRDRKFKEFAQKIETGESPAEIIKAHIEISKKYGFGVGYHTSAAEIKPDQKGHWTIKGTENDHRDNDVNMAYYSTKYRHIYREKNPKYVYIVRTEPQAHKTDGIWSRAGSLSIITKVPFSDVASYVEDETKKIVSKSKI